MIPVMCQTVTSELYGTTGDCVRACIASIMELQSEDVPHFFHDDCDGETGIARIQEWLYPRGFAPFMAHYDGSATFDQLMEMHSIQHAHVTYMLFGATVNGDHVVVCRGGTMIHDPAHIGEPLVRASLSTGVWSVMVITPL